MAEAPVIAAATLRGTSYPGSDGKSSLIVTTDAPIFRPAPLNARTISGSTPGICEQEQIIPGPARQDGPENVTSASDKILVADHASGSQLKWAEVLPNVLNDATYQLHPVPVIVDVGTRQRP